MRTFVLIIIGEKNDSTHRGSISSLYSRLLWCYVDDTGISCYTYSRTSNLFLGKATWSLQRVCKIHGNHIVSYKFIWFDELAWKIENSSIDFEARHNSDEDIYAVMPAVSDCIHEVRRETLLWQKRGRFFFFWHEGVSHLEVLNRFFHYHGRENQKTELSLKQSGAIRYNKSCWHRFLLFVCWASWIFYSTIFYIVNKQRRHPCIELTQSRCRILDLIMN